MDINMKMKTNIQALFGRKPSAQTLRVLAEFARAPESWLYGYEMLDKTKLGTGSLYTILNRLNERGILVSEWRGMDLDGQTARPYRVYRLTEKGKEAAVKELADSFISSDAGELQGSGRKQHVAATQQHAAHAEPPQKEEKDKDCVA
jgi:DNA-binding PadR family transcriptional regulator